MQFTPQQMLGSGKYSHKTRIGNWSEDLELEDTKFKDFLAKREQGNLAVNRTQQKLAKSLLPVPHSYSADGTLRFGNAIMVFNRKSQGFLVTDLQDKASHPEESYAVTTNKNIHACSRSVFVLKRVDEKDGYKDNVLHYGQKFRLAVNPALTDKKLYLHSSTVSPTSCSRFSRHQEVAMFPKAEYNTAWVIEHANPHIRFESQGSPVKGDDTIVIKHCHTAHWLASDLVKYGNDYGVEYEVSVHSHQSTNKVQLLGSEKAGRLTSDIPCKYQQPQNEWVIVTSSDPASANVQVEDKTVTPAQLVAKVKETLLQRGTYGIRGLARVFKNMDDGGDRNLDSNDFKWGLYDYGIYLEDDELKTLMTYFDRDGNGVINYNEFLVGIRGDLNDVRLDLVYQAYQKLDKNGDGAVTLDDIAQIYDAKQHPDVKDGKKTEEEVFREFMKQWDTQKADGIVTPQEFAEYYKDVSASIDTDEYFAAMMKSAWKF